MGVGRGEMGGEGVGRGEMGGEGVGRGEMGGGEMGGGEMGGGEMGGGEMGGGEMRGGCSTYCNIYTGECNVRKARKGWKTQCQTPLQTSVGAFLW